MAKTKIVERHPTLCLLATTYHIKCSKRAFKEHMLSKQSEHYSAAEYTKLDEGYVFELSKPGAEICQSLFVNTLETNKRNIRVTLETRMFAEDVSMGDVALEHKKAQSIIEVLKLK